MWTLTMEMSKWLPEIISDTGVWSEPLDPDDLAQVFDIFTPEIGEELRPLLLQALRDALPTSDLNSTIVVMNGMVTACVPHPESWQLLGEYAMRRCAQTASFSAISELAWALATAEEKLAKNDFDALKVGLKVTCGELSSEQLKFLAWSCGEFGLSIPGVLGKIPFRADPATAHSVWTTLEGLSEESDDGVGGTSKKGKVLRSEPVPVIAVDGAIALEHAAALIRLADADGLWRPSVRKAPGTEDAGSAVMGRPWSALLDKSAHRSHPAVVAVRSWVAAALDAPLEQVEALRVVRYCSGEGSGPPHTDARPPGDPSLWLSGQRTVAALFFLGSLPEAAGGEVIFDELGGLHIAPREGMALLWPTVNRTGFPERQVARSARPVLGEGVVKYTVSTWLRSRPAPGEIGGAPSP